MSHQNAGEDNLAAMTDAWSAMTRGFLRTATAANRAAVSAMLPSTDESNGAEVDQIAPSIPSIDYSDLDWQFDRTVDDPDHITVGDTVTFEKALTDEDIRAFAAVSGDTNRLHLDEEFAEKTRFERPIVHGTLVSGLISAALARLPGLTIYLSQDVRFTNPVEIGARLTATVEVVEDLGKGRFRLSTDVTDEDGDVVIDGEAVVLIDEAPPIDDS